MTWFFHGISMAFFLASFLHFLLIPWTLAGPASMGSLTPTLAQVIPPCAQECLVSFITSNFPSSSCGTPPDSDCLCISSSASGLTIGEGGLECLYSECPDYDFDNSIALQVYEVCATVQGAKPNTHSTLTATSTTIVSATGGVRATPTNSNNFSYNSDSGSVFPGASSAALGTNTIIATATGSPSPFPKSTSSLDYARTTKVATGGVGLNVTPTTTSTSSTRSVAAATSSSAVAAAAKPILTKPQIAGVTVAGVGAAAIAFGLCFLVFCLRRKHRNRHSGWSFGGDKIIDSQETTPDMAAIGGGEFENHPQPSSPPAVVAAPPPRRELRIVTPASSSDDGWNRYQRSMDPEEEIALAVHPPPSKSSNHSPIDPVTPASHRTSSQLLPDKPIYSLFPPPLRVTPRNSSAPAGLRPSGPTAPRQANPPYGKYSPRFPSNMDTSQAHLQPGSSRQRSLSDPFYDDFNRSPPPNIYPYVQASRPRSPGSSRPVPRNFPGAWTTPIDIVRKPVPAHQSPSARGLRPAPSRTQQPSLPKPYPPPPPIEQHYLAAIERSHSRKDPRRKQSNSSSKLTRFSNGSETSFEDADEDEAPAARKFLSPVAESPALRSPHRSGVTYPSIPISAAESPTRTAQKRAPARPELPTRTDSLLSKRLGPQKAREIAGRLQGTHPGVDEDVRDTAKWKILVSPGLNHLESSGSPRSARGNGRTPPMNM
ncbi:hypothetical protein HO173_010573 [Letharia columbiana]|uniref:CFEM domain-containing protein n=1 Tax=Letharia columbiana TaxID=112416 RepID=A0A8H6L0S2_9LECA|nr:uncharacterized protein HO173_010573 [Letharia columbiana]KAF6231241.1 hypothetical protein HO173_010573 [Letharia columbiana]